MRRKENLEIYYYLGDHCVLELGYKERFEFARLVSRVCFY